jgi:hypothetical protein
MPVYEQTEHRDGYASLEVAPELAFLQRAHRGDRAEEQPPGPPGLRPYREYEERKKVST